MYRDVDVESPIDNALSLRGHLEGLDTNKKYKVLTSASQQRELYLYAFHPYFCVSDNLQCTIDDALSFLEKHVSIVQLEHPQCSLVNSRTPKKMDEK
jgi:hypothetical protein